LVTTYFVEFLNLTTWARACGGLMPENWLAEQWNLIRMHKHEQGQRHKDCQVLAKAD